MIDHMYDPAIHNIRSVSGYLRANPGPNGIAPRWMIEFYFAYSLPKYINEHRTWSEIWAEQRVTRRMLESAKHHGFKPRFKLRTPND